MGFGILGRRLEFLLIPVVLSIVALLLPPIDLSVLTYQLATSLEEAQTLSPGTGPASGVTSVPAAPGGSGEEFQAGLDALGMEALFNEEMPWTLLEEFPLEIVLVNRFFFRVPGYISLLPMAETNSPWPSLTASSAGDVLMLFMGAAAFGVLIGAFYLYQLGQQVTAHFQRMDLPRNVEENANPNENISDTESAGFWPRAGQMFLYFAFLLVAWLGSSLLLALILGIVGLVAPQAAISLLYFALPLLFMIYFLFIFYQTYVAAGVMMDGFTVWDAFRNSMQLVRRDFFLTLLFLFLAGFIMLGIELLLENLISLTQDHVISVLIASLIFAYVGTGVALSFLVFYRTRLLAQQGTDITQYFETQEK